MSIEDQVIGSAFAICAGMFFMVAVPWYVLRRGQDSQEDSQEVLKSYFSPEALNWELGWKKRPGFYGFGLIDILGVSVFFAFYAVPWYLSSSVEEPRELGEPGELSAALILGLIVQALQVGMVFMLLFRRVNPMEAFGLWGRVDWRRVAVAPVAVVIMWAFTLCLEGVVALLNDGKGYTEWIGQFVEGDGKQEIITLFETSSDPLVLVLMVVVACVGAPLAEEVIFRGYIYGVAKRFAGIPLAVVFSGLLFGAVHMNLAALLPLTILGIILALAYEYTGSLWGPIAIHFCFNAVTVVIQLIFKFNPHLLEEVEKNAGFILPW